MAIYNLTEVKKELRSLYSIQKITCTIEEFGEGWDIYVNVHYLDKHLSKEFICYQLDEEVKKRLAIIKAQRAYESLSKLYSNVEYEEANC